MKQIDKWKLSMEDRRKVEAKDRELAELFNTDVYTVGRIFPYKPSPVYLTLLEVYIQAGLKRKAHNVKSTKANLEQLVADNRADSPLSIGMSGGSMTLGYANNTINRSKMRL